MFLEIETSTGRRIINCTYVLSVEPLDRGCTVSLACGDDVERLETELSYEAIKTGLQFGGVEVVTRQSDQGSLAALRPVPAE